MDLRVFEISDEATLEPLAETALSAHWPQDETHRWIDIEAATPDELRELLAPLELPADILNACLCQDRSDHLISRRKALYLELPTHLGWDEPEKPYISVLCLPTTIITIHRDRLHTIEDIIHGLDAEVPLGSPTSSALLHFLIVQIGKQNIDAALQVRAEAERLDQACHEQVDALDPVQIDTLRRRVSHYASVQDDRMFCMGLLQSVDSQAFRASEHAQFIREMLPVSGISRQLIAGAEARVATLQRDYELTMQGRVDNRLRFLTMISAVFMPLTLISAIYGMNFNDLPAMGQPLGYVIVIGLMLGTAALTAGYLYWRGWFD